MTDNSDASPQQAVGTPYHPNVTGVIGDSDVALSTIGFAALRDAAESRTYVSLGQRRTSSPHEFYRYPARFSPAFAAAAIECFTQPGDLVLDPFVGGGTTAIEAMRLGRRCVAADLNPLATFVTAAKTTPLDGTATRLVQRWLDGLPGISLSDPMPDLSDWNEAGYFKDIETPETWRLRKVIALALASSPRRSPEADRFCRCVVLRTAQWALDMKSEVPSAASLRKALIDNGRAMLAVARSWTRDHGSSHAGLTILDVGLPGLASAFAEVTGDHPRAVVTSPPYPGVYVNYHRWKLRGRREIPAPYWIADRRDGNGLAYYTMGARAEPTLNTYFGRLQQAYADLVSTFDAETTLVQLVGFSDVDRQLPRYLEAMNTIGLEEFTIADLATGTDGRLWRSVPNRRWWTEARSKQGIAEHTSREVVLFHRLRPVV